MNSNQPPSWLSPGEILWIDVDYGWKDQFILEQIFREGAYWFLILKTINEVSEKVALSIKHPSKCIGASISFNDLSPSGFPVAPCWIFPWPYDGDLLRAGDLRAAIGQVRSEQDR